MVIMYVTKRTIIATVIVVFTTISVTQAHVALTFPQARKYDLDFLDNSRTKGPCGMPKGSVKTSLLSGSTFNVTWHLGYPHRGGFKLQVLDNLSRPVLDLTPVTADSEFVRTDAVAQMYTVHLPQDFECPDCTIRLQREAIEWGSSYRFWSCGDVDIKNRKMYKEDCSGHGRYLLSKCRCDRLYYGSRCQYRDECIDNNDCGDRGRCVDIQATTAPRKQCYCEIGWFGPACTKRSPIKSVDIDLTGHNHRELAAGLQMYWRILREEKEIEVVIVSNGTSYIGIGWRPQNLTAACKNFPPLEDLAGSPEYHEPKIIPKSEPEPSSEPEPKSEPEPSSVPEPSSEPEPSSKPETTNKSKPKTKPEPQSEPEPSSVPEPSSEPEPKSEPEPTSNLHKAGRAVSSRDTTNHKTPDTNDHPEVSVETSISFRVSSSQGNRGIRAAMEDETVAGKPEPAPEPISEPEPKSKSEPKAEPEPTSEPETKSEPELKSEPEPKSEPVSDVENDLKIQADPKLKPEASLLLPYTPRHDFNGMDCTDIVIGMARGTSHRIWDYYTRDRSTPRLDTFWGGKNDLTAAMGFEKDSVTTIVFRKKLKATEPTDHSIEEDLMHLIWARGQESGRYIHFPKSGLEKDFVSVKDFYKPDELKYHGHGDMRGVTTINFYEEITVTNNAAPGSNEVPQVPKITTCKGEWSYPRGCDPAQKKCEYHAAWEYLPRKDEIKFTILTNNTNTWTGIGFSDDHRMSQTDAVLGWVDKSGRPFLMDTWIGGYTSPLLDQSQDIYNTTGRISDGLTTLSFVRRRSTTDAKDLSFTDEKCLYLMFPVKGGPFNAVNKKIRKHASIPIVTPQRVCIKSCGDGPEPSTTPAPPRLAYNVEVKLIKLGQNFQAPDAGTPDFDILSNTVNAGFTRALTKLPGFHKVSVTEFKQDQENVIAKMNLELDKAQLERGRSLEDSQTSVEQILQETVAAGRVGALTLDPAYLVFEPHQLTSNVPTDDSKDSHSLLLSATKLWIVIGCIIALVIVAIVQAGCTIYRTMKHPVPHHKDNLIPNSAWKDYSAANTNYAFEAFESEEKQPGSIAHTNGSSRSTMPLTTKSMTVQHGHPPSNAQHGYTPHGNGSSHYADTRSLQRPRGYGGSHERSTYSLPRSANQPPPPHHNGYYTHRPPRPHSDQLQPDFYFMPSQRKYSGEVVRVYVDYNSPRK